MASLGLCAAGPLAPSILHAAPAPAACARIAHSDQSSAQGQTVLEHITVTAGSGGGVLKATRQTFAGAAPDASLDLADAASVLLLAAFTGYHNAACSAWLETEGKAAQAALASGHSLDMSWSGASIQHKSLHIGIDTAHLALKNGSPDANATLSFSGVTVSGVTAPTLMPSSANASFTLPQSELASLMAATAGKATSLPAVHVTIHSLTARRDTIELSGNGHATLTGETGSTSAGGHLEIHDISALIDHARQENQMKVAAALIIARMVSHSTSDGNAWDTTWAGGVLTVNGVPLPLK
ncbi:hypothetical protein GOB85_11070 [Acetobacter sp. LMG 1636]|uniref:DUF2125 domain-containing protein n=1 Tax=Acetobacter fallax TaxID=1737473 RepID=A0ABX0KCV6_9PROT|nr:hypothetical protein [Acetobacter fallax]NHO36643.1 hypothetical protein [Acetobacter fallax]